MNAFLTSPLVAALLLMVLCVEGVLLLAIWKFQRVGIPPMQVVSFLGAGGAFAVALGFALSGPSVLGISLSLSVAFFFHLTDLLLRWQK